jgi:hypothetical protein
MAVYGTGDPPRLPGVLACIRDTVLIQIAMQSLGDVTPVRLPIAVRVFMDPRRDLFVIRGAGAIAVTGTSLVEEGNATHPWAGLVLDNQIEIPIAVQVRDDRVNGLDRNATARKGNLDRRAKGSTAESPPKLDGRADNPDEIHHPILIPIHDLKVLNSGP